MTSASLIGRLTDRDHVSEALRRRRLAWFHALIAPLPRPLRILDVGGTQAFWNNSAAGYGVEILLLNREPAAVSGPPFSSVGGDARAMPEFADAEFDVVFSNSVIEHVGGLEDQRQMAKEIQRVGRRFFVQTPNRRFPVEPHTVFPLFQFLPLAVRISLVRRFQLGWIPRTLDARAARESVSSIRLLTRAEVTELFPGATIHRERLCGLTKSFVACGGFAERAGPP
jgi:hypothetical protein